MKLDEKSAQNVLDLERGRHLFGAEVFFYIHTNKVIRASVKKGRMDGCVYFIFPVSSQICLPDVGSTTISPSLREQVQMDEEAQGVQLPPRFVVYWWNGIPELEHSHQVLLDDESGRCHLRSFAAALSQGSEWGARERRASVFFQTEGHSSSSKEGNKRRR